MGVPVLEFPVPVALPEVVPAVVPAEPTLPAPPGPVEPGAAVMSLPLDVPALFDFVSAGVELGPRPATVMWSTTLRSAA